MTVQDALFDTGPVGTEGWPDRPRYLLSYAYVDTMNIDLVRKYNIDLVVDSGAFTTAASGKEMDEDAYMDWLRENADIITFALSLDVIGDYVQSRINHERMDYALGGVVNLLPTFHIGSPMHELERLCQAYPMISIGGAVGYAKDRRALVNAFKQIHRVAAEHGTKLHGLGMTGNSIIHQFPWYSVDSSGWLAPARFPSLPLADIEGKLHQLDHGTKLDWVDRQLVAQYGLDPDMVSTPGWSLKSSVGKEAAIERREWVLCATGRAYMYAEAHKTATWPEPIRIYLSGNTGNLLGGAVGVIYRAWSMGNPWFPPDQPLTPDPLAHELPGQTNIFDFIDQEPTP